MLAHCHSEVLNHAPLELALAAYTAPHFFTCMLLWLVVHGTPTGIVKRHRVEGDACLQVVAKEARWVAKLVLRPPCVPYRIAVLLLRVTSVHHVHSVVATSCIGDLVQRARDSS